MPIYSFSRRGRRLVTWPAFCPPTYTRALYLPASGQVPVPWVPESQSLLETKKWDREPPVILDSNSVHGQTQQGKTSTAEMGYSPPLRHHFLCGSGVGGTVEQAG
uniref:Uncharacterized protein n=1 Tax=Bionectria ochroleuca TaxID=29856 RepID=A0A8H7TUF1_BIOOC